MIFGTELTGALYVSWAIPFGALPPLPEPLAADRLPCDGGDVAFVTLVHFRQRGLHAEALPWPRFTYPQANLRICARDGDGVATVSAERPRWYYLGIESTRAAWTIRVEEPLFGERAAKRENDVR